MTLPTRISPGGTLASFITPKSSHILYLGADLRTFLRLPSIARLAMEMVEDLRDREWRDMVKEAIELGEDDLALQLLDAFAGRDRVVDHLRHRLEDEEPARGYSVLGSLPVRGIITENIDWHAETAFSHEQPLTVTSLNAGEMISRLDESPFIALKLRGDIRQTDSVLLTDVDYRRSLRRSPDVQRLMSWMFQRRALLFIGTPIQTVQEILGEYAADLRRSGRPHIVLLPKEAENRALQALLNQRFNIRFVFFERTGLENLLLETVISSTVSVGGGAEKPRSFYTADFNPEGPISRLRVRNIGPFRSADVRVSDGWNIILGDNGSGKSTLLRALALALASDTPTAEMAAGGLLSYGAKEGSVRVSIGGRDFGAELTRSERGVRVVRSELAPLDAMRRVVLGFPALRGLSARELPGPSPVEEDDLKSAGLMHLLSGDADTRLNNIEQVIVNALAVGKSDLRASRGLVNDDRFVSTLFELLESITPGIVVQWADVNPVTWKVEVETPDGRVPIDMLSQGMRSAYNWIGELLRRLFIAHPTSTSPREEAAVVLIDEIDAHLHPAWQQRIAPVLSSLFPRTQFIATTHSPLVISSLTTGNVIVASRDEPSARPVLRRRKIKASNLRADQILTSDLFGLRTSRSESFQEQIDRYSVLASRLERSQQEEAELRTLTEAIDQGVELGETPAERRRRRALADEISQLEQQVIGSVQSVEEVELLQRRIADLQHRIPGSKGAVE
jgi:energy-coupling factor transporter ATP-binding protein EcfA2